MRYHTAWVESETTTRDAADLLQEIELSRTGSPQAGTTDSEDDDFNIDLTAELDFLSEHPSTSLPNIHFGSDSDESSSDELLTSNPHSSMNSNPQTSFRASRVRTPNVSEEKTLFIQMEFVDGKNLREVRNSQ